MDKKEKIGKKNRLMQYGVLIVALIMIVSSGVYATIYITDEGIYDGDNNNIYVSRMVYDYLIVNHSNIYYAISGVNGSIVSSGVYANIPINYCISHSSDSDTGVNIMLASGIFYINDTIDFTLHKGVVDNGVILQGQGKGWIVNFTRVILVDGSDCNMIKMSGHFSEVKNIFLDGNKDGNSGNVHVIYAAYGADLRINNVCIVNADDDGIHIHGSKHCIISECWIEYCAGDGIEMDLSSNGGRGQHKIINNHCPQNGMNGIYISNNGIEGGVIISGNTFVSNNQLDNSIYADVKLYASACNVVSNNIFFNTSENSILLIQGYRNVISCNTFKDNGDVNIYNIKLDQTSHHNIISDNSYTQYLTKSIFIDDETCYDNIISGFMEGSSITDNGLRNIINGVSYNDGIPGSSGEWKTVKVEGTLVWDTGNSTLYICANNSWHQI